MPRLLRIPEAASLGIHAAVILAGEPDRPIPAHELAERLRASEAHLAKVMQRLVRAGLADSTRGPKGGFMLGKSSASITLLDVYEAVEGRVEPAACLFGTPVCGRNACIFGGYLEKFDTDFRRYLASSTLEELAAQKETLDVRP